MYAEWTGHAYIHFGSGSGYLPEKNAGAASSNPQQKDLDKYGLRLSLNAPVSSVN